MIKRLTATLAAMLLIAAAVVICYENSLDGEFVFDDSHSIVNNDNIKNLSFEDSAQFAENLKHIVGYNPFRPLLSFSFALHYSNIPRLDKDQRGFIPDPEPFHIANVAIHLINGLLVFFLVRMLVGWRRKRHEWAVPYFSALAAALLFSTAAVNTESVTYIVGRSNSMCTMFCLASILAFLGARKVQESRYRDEGSTSGNRGKRTLSWTLLVLPLAVLVYKLLAGFGADPRVGVLAAGGLVFLWAAAVSLLFVFAGRRLQIGGDALMLLAYFFFGLAALTKELAIVLPFLLLLLEVLVLSGGKRGYMKRRWKHHALMLGTIVLLVGLRFAVIGAAAGKQTTAGWEGTRIDYNYMATQVSGPVMTGYLRQFFWPVQLNIDNDVPIFTPQQAAQPLTLNFAVLFAIIMVTIWLTRYARMFAAGVLWYFIALIPTSTVLQFSDAMDEGRIYLSMIGLCWAAAVAAVACFNALRSRLRIIAGTAAVVLLAGIVAMNCYHTRKRNIDYGTAIRLWHDTVLKSPLKARVHEGLGYELMTYGQHLREMNNHVRRAENLRDYLKVERSRTEPDEKSIETYQEMLDERIAELKYLIDDQRKYLAAAGMMFRAAVTFYEGDTPTTPRPGADGPESIRALIKDLAEVPSLKSHENLAVSYSSRSKTLEHVESLSEELGINRAETLRQMESCRNISLRLYQFVVHFRPAPNVMTNYGTMYLEIAYYLYRKENFDDFERHAQRAEMFATLTLRVNSNFHPARYLIRKIAIDLALYYDPYDEKRAARKDAEKARYYYEIWEKWAISKDDRDDATERIRRLTERSSLP